MAGGWTAVEPSFAVTGIPNAGSLVDATVTSTCPSNTSTCVPGGSARTLKTVPRARTAAAVVATVNGRLASLATWKRASPRTSSMCRSVGNQPTRTFELVLRKTTDPSCNVKLLCSPTTVWNVMGDCQLRKVTHRVMPNTNDATRATGRHLLPDKTRPDSLPADGKRG